MSKIFFFCLGCVFLLIGIAGLILPGLPGTFPLILAAGFFAKSDPRIERWMLEHPKIGPPIRCWREEGSISRKHKTIAVTMLWISMGLVSLTAPLIGTVTGIVCALGVTAYILSRPTRIVCPICGDLPEKNPVDAC